MPPAEAVEFEYQPESRTLSIRLGEEFYRYIDIPPAVFEAFKKASSKSRFVEKYLRDRYCHQRR